MFGFGSFDAAWVGMTDSSRARLLAGLPPAPSVAMCCISFCDATLLALEVRWTPSPAHMLAPSTVVSSCKGDSSGPKNPSIFRILASDVRSPAAVASVRHFSDPVISVRNSGSNRLDTCLVSPQQAAVTYLGSGTVKTTYALSVCSMIFSIDFIVALKAGGGGGEKGVSLQMVVPFP